MNTRRTTLAVLALGLAAAGSTLSGCASGNTGTSIHAIRRHPTPELANVNRTRDAVKNTRSIAFNQHWRALGNDLGHLVFYSDRPTRLVSSPVAH